MEKVVAVTENYRPIKFFNKREDAEKWQKDNMKPGKTYSIVVFEVF